MSNDFTLDEKTAYYIFGVLVIRMEFDWILSDQILLKYLENFSHTKDKQQFKDLGDRFKFHLKDKNRYPKFFIYSNIFQTLYQKIMY